MGEKGTAGSGISAYGGLYHDGQQQLDLTTPEAYEPIAMNAAMPARSMAANANSALTIQEAGDYEVSYDVAVQANTPSTLRVAVRNNGVVLLETQDTQRLLQGGDTSLYVGRFSAQAIVNLVPGDNLELAIAAVAGVSGNIEVATSGYANTTLIVKKLSE